MAQTFSTSPAPNPSTNNSPALQGWAPDPNYIEHRYNYVTDAITAISPIIFKIKDMIGTDFDLQFSEYRLRSSAGYGINNPFAWLVPSSYNNNGYPINGSTIPLTNGTQFTFTPVLQNTNLFTGPGTYSFNHMFIIEGKNSSNAWVTIEVYYYYFYLVVTDEMVSHSPDSFVINHQKNSAGTTNVPSVTLTASQWTLYAPEELHIELTTPDSNVTITQVGNGYKAVGTGTGTVELNIDETHYDSLPVGSYQKNVFKLIGDLGSFVGFVPVTINVLQGIEVTPTTLSFEAVKTIEEPSAQLLTVNSPVAYSYTAPAWLQIQTTSTGLSVAPMPTTNMDAGAYEGYITINGTINGSPILVEINVVYELLDFVQNPYPANQKAFTLDPKYFTLSSALQDTYFEVETRIKTFPFYSDSETETPITEKFLLHKGKQMFTIAPIVHRLMQRFLMPNNNQTIQYKNALVDMIVSEKNTADGTLVKSVTLPTLEFFAGIKPFGNLNTNKTFLQRHNQARRITPTSFDIIHTIVSAGTFRLDFYRNGVLETTQTLPFTDGNQTLSSRIDFSENIGAVAGDLIVVKLIESYNGTDTIRDVKQYIVFPQQKYSTHIIWEDEYLLQSMLHLTGSFAIKNEFDFRTQKNYENLVEVVKNIDITAETKLTINTGWLSTNDIPDVESLMRSQRAFIEANGQIIYLVPSAKSIVLQDKNRELIEFTLEFIINRETNEKVITL